MRDLTCTHRCWGRLQASDMLRNNDGGQTSQMFQGSVLLPSELETVSTHWKPSPLNTRVTNLNSSARQDKVWYPCFSTLLQQASFSSIWPQQDLEEGKGMCHKPCVWFRQTPFSVCGPGSVVGITTGYGVDGPGIESRWGARFSASVQTAPGTHTASCTMGNGSIPEVNNGRGVTLTPNPLLVPW